MSSPARTAKRVFFHGRGRPLFKPPWGLRPQRVTQMKALTPRTRLWSATPRPRSRLPLAPLTVSQRVGRAAARPRLAANRRSSRRRAATTASRRAAVQAARRPTADREDDETWGSRRQGLQTEESRVAKKPDPRCGRVSDAALLRGGPRARAGGTCGQYRPEPQTPRRSPIPPPPQVNYPLATLDLASSAKAFRPPNTITTFRSAATRLWSSTPEGAALHRGFRLEDDEVS